MATSSDVLNLLQQLATARQEINNLRKQLNTLKHVQRKEIQKVLTLLKENQCCNCSKPNKSEGAVIDSPPLCLEQIGIINSQFPNIRGTPRQPTVTMDNSLATLTLHKTIFTNPSHSLQGLENYSHLWIIFLFHVHGNHAKAKVAPPRLGGEKLGVFATRSPHRPSPIGLSLVKIDRIEEGVIYFSGVDMVDGTPVVDVKPYIPQYDQAQGVVKVPKWISDNASGNNLVVTFEPEVHSQITQEKADLISKVLQEDPRSVYLRSKLGCSSYTWNMENLSVECAFDDVSRTVKVMKVFDSSIK